ncbi:rootletin-like [Pomacea canaliculata]|uniref:rootletin-like n=1 Tax=Pomacea canaliculata TaxID=400727 RepID=UPI000D72A671|nr:rootletin-like [Pomacea canaliculata]XP_025111013.1 rootletin-like [Pomacea canaliculata]
MQDIWGNDLTGVEGLDPNRHERYKQLIASHTLSDEDTIELKQALASAIVENDILQAKLNNARHEIQGKLGKTNEVLDDCRKHLAKSQAENMELRTTLEQEREQSQAMEERIHKLELLVQQVQDDNEELEEELDHTLSMLDRSISENKPDISALKEQNAELHGRASVIETENSSLKKEMDDLKRSHSKSVHTIRELRECLDKLREERTDLLHKLKCMEQTHNESKVKTIISNYQEKGAIDEAEREYQSNSLNWSNGHLSPGHHRSSTRNDDIVSLSTQSKAGTPNISSITQVAPSPARNLSYSMEDLSPTVPSNYREIYPHRKSRYQSLTSDRCSSPDPHASPVNFITYPDLQPNPNKLDLDEDFKRRMQSPPPISRSGPAASVDEFPIKKPIPYRPYHSRNETASSLHAKHSASPTRKEAVSIVFMKIPQQEHHKVLEKVRL